jgi:hypothetical protein
MLSSTIFYLLWGKFYIFGMALTDIVRGNFTHISIIIVKLLVITIEVPHDGPNYRKFIRLRLELGVELTAFYLVYNAIST